VVYLEWHCIISGLFRIAPYSKWFIKNSTRRGLFRIAPYSKWFIKNSTRRGLFRIALY